MWLQILLSLLLVPLIALTVGVFISHRSLYHANSTSSDILLARSPNHISTLDIVATFTQIILKYIPTPWTKPASLRAHSNGKDFALPAIRVRGPLVITTKDEESFRLALASSSQGGGVEARLNPLFIPCLTGPVLPLLLSQRSCPIFPLGAVNTSNKFTILSPAIAGDASVLRQASKAGDLTFEASFGGESKNGLRRARGMEFCVDVEVFHKGKVIVQQKLWFLMFLSRYVQPLYQPPSELQTSKDSKEPDKTGVSIDIPLAMTPKHPLLWAACCKDYNPIHVSSLGAKMFGFRSVIAHGNHVAAMAIEAITRANNKAVFENSEVGKVIGLLTTGPAERTIDIQVKFNRPMTLPIKTEVSWRGSGNGLMFEVGKYTSGSMQFVK